MEKYFMIYVAFINIAAFFMMLIDKKLAQINGKAGAKKDHSTKTKYQRIPELTLLTAAFLFGAVGELLGMILFRHKTKKAKFVILVPLFILLNAAAVWFILYRV